MRYVTLGALACVLMPPAMAAVPGRAAAEIAKPLKMALDLGSYRGYWRIDGVNGSEMTHDECFTQRVCRETIKSLPAGDYALVLSSQPQSAQVRFKLTPGALIVTSGAGLASADGLTLRLKGLRQVVFDTNGYRGAWSLDLWKGAEATGFFKRDGGEQTVELFPDTTYTINIGPMAAERFQIGRDDRIILIDDMGLARVVPDAANHIEFQTIDVAVYPMPLPDTAQWLIEGLAPPDGQAAFAGPRIMRLVQGAKYRVSEPAAGSEASSAVGATGKACNMIPQVLKLDRSTVHVLPIAASCAPQ